MDTPYHTLQQKFGKEDAIQIADSISKGLALIRNNVNAYAPDCGYKELPGYLFSQDKNQSEELEKIYEASKECGVAVDWTKDIPVPIPFEKALIFPGQASFHPTRYLMSLAKAFEDAGGTILEDCRVTAVDEGEPHKVSTGKGQFNAEYFVYATHIPPGVNLLHFRCAPYRSYAMALKMQKYLPYPDGLVYDMYDPYHYYRTQEIDGEHYLIAGGEDHKTGHVENTDQCFRKLEAYINRHFKIESVEHKWSSQYFEPNDGLPYIGNLPGHGEKLLVATGYGGNGMTYSAVAALVLSDLIVNGKSEFEELYDPNRIKIIAGFNNFMKEAADVVGKLVKKIIPADKLHELADLAPGEARVVKFDNHRLAIYRDEHGELYTLNSACTHIKCEVNWNSAEKSWDCPCHGSRFSYTGEMLTAPARKDM